MKSASTIPSVQNWADRITGRLSMVQNFNKLGFVKPKNIASGVVYIEDERDPAFPR